MKDNFTKAYERAVLEGAQSSVWHAIQKSVWVKIPDPFAAVKERPNKPTPKKSLK